jgi:putative restriction endonuclease
MEFYIGVTDEQWFNFHKIRKPDEVNFWRPMSRLDFKALKLGEPFLFKLHYPNHFIVGGGFFANYSRLPLSVAWDIFGEKNGAADPVSFRDDITRYREKRKLPFEPNPNIGCITLTSPVFFDESQWFPAPEDWSSNIVQGKTYDVQAEIGGRIWGEFQERLSFSDQIFSGNNLSPKLIVETRERYGVGYITKPRLGQSAFRILVTDAYKRKCAITGERTLPVLQASHIKPYAQQGPHSVDNGILLRADLHILFDSGYITITEKHNVVVSERIKAEFENGKEYYALHGKPLVTLPDHQIQHPSKEFLLWHNEQVFRS